MDKRANFWRGPTRDFVVSSKFRERNTMLDGIKERNQEIGRWIRIVRSQRRLSVSRCAALLGTTRRRYVDMEEGKSGLTVAELEVLLRFFNLSPVAFWPECGNYRVKVVQLHQDELLSVLISN
jgi:hypothetical protein